MHDSNLKTQGIIKIFFIMALQKAWHILQVIILNSSWPKWQHQNWVSVLRAFWGKVIVSKIHPLISKHVLSNVDIFSCYLWWWLLMILCFCQIIIVMNTSRPRQNWSHFADEIQIETHCSVTCLYMSTKYSDIFAPFMIPYLNIPSCNGTTPLIILCTKQNTHAFVWYTKFKPTKYLRVQLS